jgi:hypothetical protein
MSEVLTCGICFEDCEEVKGSGYTYKPKCGVCSHLICIKCCYKTIGFCPASRLFTNTCAVCKSVSKLGNLDELDNDESEHLKILMANGNDAVFHEFRDTCCSTDFKMVMKHTPCIHGCKDCIHSKLQFVCANIGGRTCKPCDEGNWIMLE